MNGGLGWFYKTEKNGSLLQKYCKKYRTFGRLNIKNRGKWTKTEMDDPVPIQFRPSGRCRLGAD